MLLFVLLLAAILQSFETNPVAENLDLRLAYVIVSGRNGGLCLLVVAICNHVGNNETIAVIICSDDEMMVCLSESIPCFSPRRWESAVLYYVCLYLWPVTVHNTG